MYCIVNSSTKVIQRLFDVLLNKAFTTVKSANETKLRDIHELLSGSSLLLRFFAYGKVWGRERRKQERGLERVLHSLFPTRLIFSRRWRNARPEALTMKACSKTRFSRVVLFNILHNLCSFTPKFADSIIMYSSLKRTFVINAFLSFCWATLCRYLVIRNSNSVLSQGRWLAETKST